MKLCGLNLWGFEPGHILKTSPCGMCIAFGESIGNAPAAVAAVDAVAATCDLLEIRLTWLLSCTKL